METLVEHARRELAALGEERDLAACLLATVAAYSSFGHSGGSHEASVEMLTRLLRHEALTPLTMDPTEWTDRAAVSGVPMWQNLRDPRAISTDRGVTFRYVDDRLGRLHTSVLPPAWLKALKDRDGLSFEQARAAVHAYLGADPIRAEDRAALDGGNEQDRMRYMLRRWGREGAMVALLAYEAGAPEVMV